MGLEKKEDWYKLFILLIISIFLLVFIHEMGHYVVAKHYDLNPKIHIGSLGTYNSVAYVTHDIPPNVQINRKIALAGNYAVLSMGLLCIIYLFYKSNKMNSLGMVFVTWLLLYIIISLMLAYNPMIYPHGSDLWQLIELN